MRSLIITAGIILFLIPTAARPAEIRVAMASNMSNPSVSIKKSFEAKHPDITVSFISGSSGKLFSQIMNGAPFDLFMSADTNFPEQLEKAGMTLSEPAVYAEGRLVLFCVRSFKPHSKIDCLLNQSFRKVAIANPEVAPYGKASVEVLKHNNLYHKLRGRLVFSETVSGSLQMGISAADAAFIAMSSLYNKDIRKYDVKGKYWIEVPKSQHSPLKQSMVLLKRSRFPEQASSFYKYMLSAEARYILKEYGYD